MLLRITTVLTNLVAAIRACRSVRNMRASGLRSCDEKTCVNRSLFQALQSSSIVLLVSHCLNCFADKFSVFSAYYFIIFHPTCCSVNHAYSTFSRGNLQMHTWTAKIWMQYSASHVAYTATMALLLSQKWPHAEAISEHLYF